MFNLGFTELILLGVIALIFIGPQQLPELARTIGRLLNEWKRATSDFKSSIGADFAENLHIQRIAPKPEEDPIHNSDSESSESVKSEADTVAQSEEKK